MCVSWYLVQGLNELMDGYINFWLNLSDISSSI